MKKLFTFLFVFPFIIAHSWGSMFDLPPVCDLYAAVAPRLQQSFRDYSLEAVGVFDIGGIKVWVGSINWNKSLDNCKAERKVGLALVDFVKQNPDAQNLPQNIGKKTVHWAVSPVYYVDVMPNGETMNMLTLFHRELCDTVRIPIKCIVESLPLASR